jgi:CTP-dependent riboflavin kinase
MTWSRVETGTLNVRLNDYLQYTKNRRVDFLIPHTTSTKAGWDCYFQRCSITANETTVQAVIATTVHNYWGMQCDTIEIRASIKLRTALAVSDGSAVIVNID